MNTPLTAREVAARVVRRVMEDQAFLAAVLSTFLDESSLGPKDRGLATEIAYGVIRTEPFLRRRLLQYGKLRAGDEETLSHLLVAAYQIEFLDRVPAHAAVSEGVSAVRRASGARQAGFANAVLRKVAEGAKGEPVTLLEAVLSSAPSWLRKRLTRDVGEEEMARLLVGDGPVRLGLRARNEGAFLALQNEGIAEASECPLALRFLGRGDPRKLPAYATGDFLIQEIGAQWIARALSPEPGQVVLDVCAGRGQKTAALCDRLGEGSVVATDLHEHKIQSLKEELARLGLRPEARVHDWTTRCPEDFRGRFDRVLVDAPCTGVGTLRRRPEIMRRLRPEDPARLAALQAAIVKNAAEALKPGGRLVFATCSVFREEAEDVLALVGEQLSPAVLPGADLPTPEPGEPDGRENLRLLPGKHGTDGYFLAGLSLRS